MKAMSRYTAEQFFRKAIFAEHQFAVASKTLNCFWIYGQRLKNALGSWFLIKLLALELFPQKQIYWTPFGGCLESYFQLQFPVHYFLRPLFTIWKTSSRGLKEKSVDWFPYDWWTGCQNIPFYGLMWIQKHSIFKKSF